MQAGGTVGKVAEAEGNGDGVEGAIGEGEFQGIGLGQFRQTSAFCLGQEGAGEIEAYNLGLWQGLPKHEGDIAGPTCEVQYFGGVLAGHRGHKLFTPANVHPQAEESVQAVIVRG